MALRAARMGGDELRLWGLAVRTEKALSVHHPEKRVCVYLADIFVADRVLVELMAVSGMTDVQTAQHLNYLKGQPAPRRCS